MTRDWTQPSDKTLVEYRAADGVAVLTLCDPPANTYSYAMMRQLDDAILRARFDEHVHAIVLTGSGSKFFCAGANIQMLGEVSPSFKYFFCLHANETLNRLEQTPKLVIAAINGHCVGGGLEIALACDIRIARRGAGKMGLPEINLGVLPGTGGTQRLTRLLGKARAMQLMVEGETFPIERAQELGLVHHVYDASSRDDFVAQVVEYAKRLGPPGKAPLAVGRIKRAVQSGADMPLEQGLALERELQAELFASHDAGEGLAAYVGKRTPRFEGR